MNKRLIEKAINETRQCLIHYWRNNIDYARDYFADDIILKNIMIKLIQ